MWKEAGVKVIPVVASVALAKRMERAGADAIVAEGCESGGHVGESTTMTLVPQVVDAVDIPVIAAGGIGDGRGIAAAFMLGAKAVQMGTAFVVTEEAQVHQNYKDKILKASDIDTRVTGRTTGHPVRALRNEMTKKYLKMEQEGAPFEELELMTLGGLRKAVVDGDVKTGSVMSGQIAGLVNEQMSCQALITTYMPAAASSLAIAAPIPREAPVTTATFFSILFITPVIFALFLYDLFQIFPCCYITDLDTSVNLFHKSCQSLAWPDFDKCINSVCDHFLHALLPANGRCKLCHK